MKRLFAAVVTSTLLMASAPAEAQFDSVGSLDFPTSGAPEAQPALPQGRRHSPQLRLEAGDRRVSGRAAA